MKLPRKVAPLTLGIVFASLFTFLSAGEAEARDLTGRWGLGVSTAFGPNGLLGSALSVPGIAARYHVSENLVINPGLGIVYTSKASKDGVDGITNTDYTVGARILYNVAQEANSAFYLGGGIVVDLTSSTDDATPQGRTIRLPLVFGVELFFSKASSFAVHAEGGLEVSQYTPKDGAATTAVNTVGGAFNVGFTWYFSGGGGGDGGE